MKLMRSHAFPYFCMPAVDLDCRVREKTHAIEIRCYRRLLNISFKDHVMRRFVERSKQPTGILDELLPLIKKRKLKWFGHVSVSSGLAKTILQGTVKGKRIGRQKKRWEDNIKEYTGMDFASSNTAAENRTRWKWIVADLSVVPRRPSKVMG